MNEQILCVKHSMQLPEDNFGKQLSRLAFYFSPDEKGFQESYIHLEISTTFQICCNYPFYNVIIICKKNLGCHKNFVWDKF